MKNKVLNDAIKHLKDMSLWVGGCIAGKEYWPQEEASDREYMAQAEEIDKIVLELERFVSIAETKQYSTPKEAAKIVNSMLKTWGISGAVYYSPAKQRFRLCGEDSTVDNNEICVGVYLPSVPMKMLEEDFEAIKRECETKRVSAIVEEVPVFLS